MGSNASLPSCLDLYFDANCCAVMLGADCFAFKLLMPQQLMFLLFNMKAVNYVSSEIQLGA